MKTFTNLFFCFITLTFCSVITWAQCPPGDVILNTQAEVDNFATTYPSCTEITGALRIGDSSNASDITDLSGLGNVTSIGGYLSINNNVALTNLSGLGNVTSIGGVGIYTNTVLADLSGLENVTSIGDNLLIWTNGSLTDLSGLENLTSIEGVLEVYNNDALMDLSGLENVTSIGDGLGIYYNNVLMDLDGLENVTSIGGDLDIRLNTALTDLSGLGNVTSIEGDLKIYDNSILSICAVSPICDYLGSGSVSEIYDNAPNCNSAEEILALCTVSTTTPDNLPQITISPNPSTGIFQINGIPQGTYQIHDITGRIIQSGDMKNDLSIDISQEARGVYFMSIQIENETITKRIIKM